MKTRIRKYYNDLSDGFEGLNPKNSKRLRFLRQFISSPMQTGSVIPSSKLLANAMSKGLWDLETRRIVEYGPGTGALTRRLVNDMPENAEYLAIEINDDFVSSMTTTFPQVNTIKGSAEDVQRLVGEVNAVVSGLPFFNLPSSFGLRVLEETHAALSEDGFFRTFMYVPAYSSKKMRQFREHGEKLFSRIETSVVGFNFPPAIVVTMYKADAIESQLALPSPSQVSGS